MGWFDDLTNNASNLWGQAASAWSDITYQPPPDFAAPLSQQPDANPVTDRTPSAFQTLTGYESPTAFLDAAGQALANPSQDTSLSDAATSLHDQFVRLMGYGESAVSNSAKQYTSPNFWGDYYKSLNPSTQLPEMAQEVYQQWKADPSLGTVLTGAAGEAMKAAIAPLKIADPLLQDTPLLSSANAIAYAGKGLGAVLGASTVQPDETLVEAAKRGWDASLTWDAARKFIDGTDAQGNPLPGLAGESGQEQKPWLARDMLHAVNPAYWASRGLTAAESALSTYTEGAYAPPTPPPPTAPIEDRVGFYATHPSWWVRQLLGTQDTIGGNVIYDPLTPATAMWGPVRGEPHGTFLGTGAGEELLRNAATAGRGLVEAMGPSARTAMVDFVQKFSRTAFRTPGEVSYLSEIEPIIRNSEAVQAGRMDLDFAAVERQVEKTAKQFNVAPEFVQQQMANELEVASLSTRDTRNLGPIGYTAQPDGTWARNPMPPVDTSRTAIINDALDAAAAGDTVTFSQHLDNLTNLTGDATFEELKQQARAGAVPDLRDALLRKANDPFGVADSSTAPEFKLTDIPIQRQQSSLEPMEWSPRGGPFNTAILDRSEVSSYAGKVAEEGVGGENKFVRYYTPRNPLLIEGSLVGPDTLKYIDNNLEKFQLPPQIKDYLDTTGTGLDAAVSDAAAYHGSNLTHPSQLTKGYEWLNQMLPADEMRKLDEYLAKTPPLEKMSVVEDRLAAELAKLNGHDTIITQSYHPDGKGGFKKVPYEVLPLDPSNYPTPIPDIITQAQRGLETGRTLPLDSAIVDLATTVKKTFDGWMLDLKHEALYRPLLGGDLEYLPHYLTDEASTKWAQLREPYSGLSPEIRVSHGSQLERALKDIPLTTINDYGRQGRLGELGLKDLEGVRFDKFLEDNPVKLYAQRARMELASKTQLRLLDDSAQRLGTDITSIPNELRAAFKENHTPLSIVERAKNDSRLALVADRYKNIYYEPEVAKHLNRVFQFETTPRADTAFLRYIDTANSWYKPIVLNVSPGTFMRNHGGGLWNNYLHDVGPEDLAASYKVPRGEWDSLSAAERTMADGHTYSGAEWDKLSTNFGIGGGFLGVESIADGVFQRGAKGIHPFNLPVLGKGMRGLYHMNQMVETANRQALFIHEMRAHGNPVKAALTTLRAHGDYVTMLTDFERAALRRSMPFYMWTRFNAPLQATMFVKNPRPFLHMAQVMRVVQNDELSQKLNGVWRNLEPQWVRDNIGLPVSKDANGQPQIFVMGYWVPFNDMDVLLSPHGAITRAGQLLSPIFRLPAETGLNLSFRTGKKLEEWPGEMTSVAGVPMRGILANAVKYLRPVSMLDQIVQPRTMNKLPATLQDHIWKAVQVMFGVGTYKLDIEAASNQQQRRINYLFNKWNDYYQSYLESGSAVDKENANKIRNQLLKEWGGNK